MHKITNLWTFELNIGRRSCEIIQHPCRTSCVLSDAWTQDLSWGLEVNSNILVTIDFFLKNYGTSEGAVSHNSLYYQQLSIARCQVSFLANNYFEQCHCNIKQTLMHWKFTWFVQWMSTLYTRTSILDINLGLYCNVQCPIKEKRSNIDVRCMYKPMWMSNASFKCACPFFRNIRSLPILL